MRAFACRLADHPYETTIHARNRNQAKYIYLLRVQDPMPDARWTDIRCRTLGDPVTDKAFRETAQYRGVPFARIGMRVSVDEKFGYIVGKNSSANFDVLFDGDKIPSNCHPNWMITYYSDDGAVLASY